MFNRLLTRLKGEKRSPMREASTAEQAPRPVPLDVTDEDFDTVVLHTTRLAVVDFWADWCAPCQMMSAYVDMLAQTYQNQTIIAALDVDANPATSERYAVLGLPTLIFFRGGAEIDRIVGVVSFEELCQRVETLLAEVQQVHRERREDAENIEGNEVG